MAESVLSSTQWGLPEYSVWYSFWKSARAKVSSLPPLTVQLMVCPEVLAPEVVLEISTVHVT